MKGITATITNRHAEPIRSVEEWGTLAKPASASHWQDGRSAKELAKAWISGDGQVALRRLLDTRKETARPRIESAVAEAQVAFDGYPGGKRNHDLLIRAHCSGGKPVMGLEAKADETFGQTVGEYDRNARALSATGQRTNAPDRLRRLLDEIGAMSLERVPHRPPDHTWLRLITRRRHCRWSIHPGVKRPGLACKARAGVAINRRNRPTAQRSGQAPAAG